MMSKTINKESGKKSDCITIDTTDDEDEGYVTIHYEQPNKPALEIPTENNGDLSWKIVQALDSKIIRLTILSKEKRRVLKLVNGIIKEPKGGWKSCKVFALVDKNADTNVQDTLPFAPSSQLSSIAAKNDSPVLSNAANVASSIKQNNVSAVISCQPSKPSVTPQSPDEIYDTKPDIGIMNVENNVQEKLPSVTSSRLSSISNKNEDSQFSTNAVNVLSSIKQENVQDQEYAYPTNVSAKLCNPNSTTSLLPELACRAKPVNCSSNKENSRPENAHYPSSITLPEPTLNDLFAVYKVKSFLELKNLMKKQYEITADFLDIFCGFLRKALIKHADKNVFSLLCIAKNSDVFYHQLVQKAAYVCKLCRKPLTIGHLLQEEHLKEYYHKFRKEIPEIDIIIDYFYLNSLHNKLVSQPGFSTNAHLSQQFFDEYKNAFFHRISQQNLIMPAADPLFIDRFLFMRENLKYYYVPPALNSYRPTIFLLEKAFWTFPEVCYRMMSINHIKNALTQEDLDWFCKILSYIHNDENGYQIKLPLYKRKAYDGEANEDTVPKKRPKMIFFT